jgi:hypothetical protein
VTTFVITTSFVPADLTLHILIGVFVQRNMTLEIIS